MEMQLVSETADLINAAVSPINLKVHTMKAILSLTISNIIFNFSHNQSGVVNVFVRVSSPSLKPQQLFPKDILIKANNMS